MIDQALDTDDVQSLQHVPWHIEGLALQPVNGGINASPVHGREGRVAGVHGLEESLGLVAADFSYKDELRPLPHGSPQEVEHVDRISAFCQGFAGDTRYPVVMEERDLAGVFNADHFCHGRDEERDRIERGCLAGCRPPVKQEAFVVLDGEPEVDERLSIERAVLQQFDRGEWLFPEFPYRKRCARVVTSVPNVSWRRETSGRVASIIGDPVEICFPDRWASVMAMELRISGSNVMFVLIFRYLRWYRKGGIRLPSQEISSSWGSFISGSSRDQ